MVKTIWNIFCSLKKEDRNYGMGVVTFCLLKDMSQQSKKNMLEKRL